MESKRCKTCGEEKPLTEYHQRSKRDPVNGKIYRGRRPHCKACVKAGACVLILCTTPTRFDDARGAKVKRCSRCEAEKPLADFPAGKRGAWCIDCLRAYGREYIKTNRQKRADYYQQNRERIIARVRQYEKENREKVNARKAVYWSGRADARRERGRRYYIENKEKSIDRCLQRRARKRATERAPYSRTEILARDGGICYLCGRAIAKGQLALDHVIPLSRGGADTPDNIRAAHRSCNSSKHDKTPDEYFRWRALVESGAIKSKSPVLRAAHG